MRRARVLIACAVCVLWAGASLAQTRDAVPDDARTDLAPRGAEAAGDVPSGLIAPDQVRSVLRRLEADNGPGMAADPAGWRGVRGQLRPVRQTVLAAGLGGRIEAISVEPGEAVKAGDPLVRMDCAALQADQAAVAAKQRAADARYSVNRKLAEMNNISGLEVDLSRAEVAVARAEQQRIAARMRYCTVSAPFAGVVTAKRAEAFQHVQEGEPLLDLVDNSELILEVAVPSAWLAEVTPGHVFSMHVEELGAEVRGHILRSEGRVDPVSQTVRLLGRLEDPPPQLMAGMSGDVVFAGLAGSP